MKNLTLTVASTSGQPGKFGRAFKHILRSLLLLAALLVGQSASATLLLYEPFPTSYGNNSTLGATASATVWNGGNGSSAAGAGIWLATNQPTALTFTGLDKTTGSGGDYAAFIFGTPAANRDRTAQISLQTLTAGSKIYCSFLINVQSTPNTHKLIGGLRSDTGGGAPSPFGIWMDSTRTLGIAKTTTSTGNITYGGSALNLDQTYLVVARATFNNGNSTADIVDLWIDPVSLADTEGSVPTPTITRTAIGGGQSPSVNSFIFVSRSTANAHATGNILIDDIRVATTWAEVTPSSACNTANITVPPSDQTGFVDQTATFTRTATGSAVTNQWQLSTDSGSSWNNISGAISSSYVTPALAPSDDGKQYRVIVGAPCDGLTVTSTPAATLSVLGLSYRTVTSGAWTAANKWEVSTNGAAFADATVAPNNLNSTNITIRNGHLITNTSTLSIDQTTIESGGLVENSGTLTVANGTGTDLTVSGTFRSSAVVTTTGTVVFESGGKYQHNFTTTGGTVPTATWNNGSTCEFIGYAASVSGSPSGLGQSFYNVTYNCPNQTGAAVQFAGALTTVNGDFTVTSTGSEFRALRLGTTSSQTMAVGGNFNVNGGLLECATGASGGPTINVGGNLSVTGGTNNLTTGAATTTFNVTGNVSITGGVIRKSAGTGNINFTGGGSHTFASGGLFLEAIGWTVNSFNTLDVGTSVLSGTGSFTLSSGASIICGNTSGLDGSITTTTKTFSTGANYTFNAAAAQITGAAFDGANNLNIDNGDGVMLTDSASVSGTVTLTDGKIITGGSTLTLGSSATISGASSTRYVSGNLAKVFGVADDQSFAFAIGDSDDYTPVELSNVDVNTGGTVTASTTGSEHSDIASSGVDGAKNVNRYWTVESGDIVVANYDATLNWVAGDVDGGANTANFIVAKFDGSWTQPTFVDPTATSIKATGLTSFSDFVTGEEQNLVATKLGFTTQPGSTNAGDVLAPVVVQVQAFDDTPIATNGVEVTLSLGSGFLAGTVTKLTDGSGAATFDDLVITNAGMKILTASATNGLSSDISSMFTIHPLAPTHLAISTPVSSPQGDLANFAPPAIVEVKDQYNNTVDSNAVINAWLASGTGGSLSGTNVTATMGVAVFSDLKFSLADHNTAESGVEIYFEAADMASATNAAITVNPVYRADAFTQQPTDVGAGETITPAVTVSVTNAVGAAAPTGVDVVMTLSGIGTLSGTRTNATDGSGVATFNDLSVDTLGSKSLIATVGIMPLFSASFTVSAGAIDHYTVTAGSSQIGGVPFGVTVTAKDSFNNTVISDSSTVVTMTSSTGNVEFDSNGDSTFGDNMKALSSGTFTISANGTVAESVTITATDANTKTGTSSAINVTLLPKYRSATSGNWGDVATWDASYDNGATWEAATNTPTYADGTIVVSNTTTVTVATSVMVDQVTVDAGAQITISAGQTLSVTNGLGTDLNVSGTVQASGAAAALATAGGTIEFQSSGVYDHARDGGTVPTATWNTGSTAKFTAITGTSGPTGMGQAFYNLTYNCPGITGNCQLGVGAQVVNGFSAAGTLRIESTGTGLVRLSSTSLATMSFGNITITGGTLQSTGTASVGVTNDVSGDITISGGSLDFRGATGLAALGSTFNIGGNLTVSGGTLNVSSSGGEGIVNFTGSSSTFTFSGGTNSQPGRIKWNVKGGATLALNNTNLVVNTGNGGTFVVDSAGTLNCGTSVISGTGAFTLSSGGTLGIGSTDGITSSGATGNIRTTTRTFNTAANYTYNGTAAQAAGNGLPATVNNLTIANAAGVTLNATTTVSGVCTVQAVGLLKGTGTINGSVVVDGTLAPGASIGTFTFDTPPTLNGDLIMEITNGPAADKLVVSSGTLTFGGDLVVSNLGGTLLGGQTFDLFDASAFAGSFSSITLPSLSTGLSWDTSQLAVDGTITTVCDGSIAVTIASTNNVTCNGGSDGSITANTATGGSGSGYTYSSNGVDYQGSPTFSGLAASVYTITAKDDAGCVSAGVMVTVTQPTAVVVTIASTNNVTCNGGSDGSITANTATGGSGSGYTYSSNGVDYQGSPTFSGLAASVYTITAKDDAGCVSAGVMVTVTQPTAVVVTIASTNNVTCNGGSDGSITANTATGGSGSGYTYSSNGVDYQGSPTFSGLAASVYTITAKDDAGCVSAGVMVTVTQPTAVVVTIASTNNVTCNGGSDGSITANTATGGSGSGYTYSSNGVDYQGSPTFSGLAASVYTITAKDDAGCVSAGVMVTVTQPTAVTVGPASLDDGVTGTAYSQTNTASGGTPPYLFSVSSGDLPDGLTLNTNTGEVSGMPTTVGTNNFTIAATDANGCLGTNSYTVAISAPFCPVITLSSLTNAIRNKGYTNTVVASGGTGPYTYVMTAGALPVGLQALTAGGLIKGKATAYSANHFTVEATDINGCKGTNSYTLLVTGPTADVTEPAVVINYPANNGFVTNASVVVTSTVTDFISGVAAPVTNVEVSVDGGAYVAAAQVGVTTKWVLNIGAPTPGPHTVAVRGTDMSGNTSSGTKARTNTFFYGVYQPLTIMTNGNGTVKGTKNGNFGTPAHAANLVVGKSYKFTVKPATNYLFSNLVYYADGTGTNAVVMSATALKGGSHTFTMATGSTFVVNFVTNRFYDVAGEYNGLFSIDETNVTHTSAGFVNLKVTAKLGFSGKLVVDGESWPFAAGTAKAGSFDLDGRGTKVPVDRTAKGKSNLVLTLQLPFDGSDTLSGTVTNLDTTTNGWVSVLAADRWVFNDTDNPATDYVGKYTLVLPGTDVDVANIPGGSGFGAVNIKTNGTISLNGYLGDGHILMQATRLGKNGDWPLYVALSKDGLNGHRGSVQGWVTVSNAPDNNLAGTLYWDKKAFPADTRLYPAGFTNPVTMKASPYVAPVNPVHVIDITNGILVLSGGNLAGSRTNTLVLNDLNKFVVNKTNTLLTVNKPTVVLTTRGTGVLTGTFQPNNKFIGIVLQQQKEAHGLWRSTPGSGSFLILGN